MSFLLRQSLRLGALSCCLAAVSANPSPAQAPAKDSPAPATTGVLRTGTQLVVVDVSVTDASGKPVHDLKASDLILTEDKSPQELRHFEEHRSDVTPPPGPPLPPMPPGVFTNYTPVPPGSTLNVLLIDTLNTPMKDQSFVRNQLAQYVKHARPGQRIAIFGLSSRLFMLQGFTSDPEVLRNAVEHKPTPRASTLLDDPVGTGADQPSLADTAAASGASASVVANMQQFEAEEASMQTQFRARFTLDAFHTLANYLAGFPGRKNLIWFSGAFPISLSPNPDLSDPFATMASMETEFRETTNLLARGQVTVYPVDARGLMTAPMFDAAKDGSKYVANPKAFNKDLAAFSQSQFEEHATMDQMADATGGKAFYNTNGLASAVEQALDLGANYYALAYSPSNHNWNGSFRRIHIALADAAKSRGYHLTYRPGYYALDPDAPANRTRLASLSEPAGSATPSPAAAAAGRARLAMQRGAPDATGLLLKVKLVPASTATTDKPAADNILNPSHPIQPPFRNYALDLVAPIHEFAMNKSPDGRMADTIEVKIYVYDADGKLLNVAGSGARLNLAPEVYAGLEKNGLRYHAVVTAPARGESFFRIGVLDVNSGRVGSVEIPASSVARLPPDAPAAAPATH